MEEIREMNGKEWPLISMWISISDVYETPIDIELFKKRLPKTLEKYTPFKLIALKKKEYKKIYKYTKDDIPFLNNEEDEKFYWYKLVNDEWLSENIDKYLKLVPFEERGEIRSTNKILSNSCGLLYYIEISKKEKENITRIELYVSHSLCDGVTVFNLYRVVRSAVLGIECDLLDNQLLNGEMEQYYTLTKEQIDSIPETWKNIEKGIRWYPKLNDIKEINEMVCQTVSYCYSNIKKFCSKYKVGVQSIINTAQTRTFKKFYNLNSDDSHFVIWCPTNTRRSMYAKDEIKYRNFYINHGDSFVYIKEWDDILKDIIEGNKAVIEYTNRYDCCLTMIKGSRGNYEGMPFVFDKLLFASNLGSCSGINHPELGLFSLYDDNSYTINMYSFHNDERIYFMYVRPKYLPDKLNFLMLNQLDEVMKFIENDVGKY